MQSLDLRWHKKRNLERDVLFNSVVEFRDIIGSADILFRRLKFKRRIGGAIIVEFAVKRFAVERENFGGA